MLLKLSLGKHNGGIQSDLFICFLKVGKKSRSEFALARGSEHSMDHACEAPLMW